MLSRLRSNFASATVAVADTASAMSSAPAAAASAAASASAASSTAAASDALALARDMAARPWSDNATHTATAQGQCATNAQCSARGRGRGGASANLPPLESGRGLVHGALTVVSLCSCHLKCVCRRRDYEIPAWAQAVNRFLIFLRSRNREALAWKRRMAALATLFGIALYAYRRYQAELKRKAKAHALALTAAEAAKSGQRYTSPSPPAVDSSDLSLGDRLMHPPESDGLIPVEKGSGGGENKGTKALVAAGVAKGTDDKLALAAAAGSSSLQKHRVAVDAIFFARLRKILSITIPSVWSVEFSYITILTGLLFARTFLSIYIAELTGMNAQSMVSRKWGRQSHSTCLQHAAQRRTVA